MIRILGLLFIVFGLCFNEYTIKIISNYETKFGTLEKSLGIIFIQILIVAIGIYILIKKKNAIQNLSLFVLSFLILALLLEISLSIRCLQDLESSTPIWIPQKYKNLNNEINEVHKNIALKNKYFFNDINHSYLKGNGDRLRIAILGDSFIWGSGVHDSVIWTRQLERLFLSNGAECDILNWGKSGWSTLDQYNFLLNEGYKYEYDYLLFAFVVNDPVMDSSSHRLLINPNGFVERIILKPFSVIFPNSVSLFTDILNNIFSTYFHYGYFNWLNSKVYTKNNLNTYSDLLQQIKKYCGIRGIHFSFILTPENHSPILKNYFDRVSKLLDDNSIPYFNLFPYVENDLKKYSIRELWANPADGHPGILVTKVYSKYIYNYLEKEIRPFNRPMKFTIFSPIRQNNKN